MSTDFDMAPTTTPASPSGAVPTSATVSQPQTRTVQLPQPEGHPVSDVKAFLAVGGPAVALIAGCYLLWAYGPWLLLGAMLLAAVAAAAAVKAVVSRARAARSNHRARTSPPRGSPNGTRGLLGALRSGSGSGAKAGGRGSTGGALPHRSGSSAALRAAAARDERRRTMRGATTAGGSTGPNPTKTSSPAQNTARKAPSRAGKTLAPGAKPQRSGAGQGVLGRTIGKTMPGGKTKAPARNAGATKPAPTRPNTTKPSNKPRPQAAGKQQRPGATGSGRPKVRVTPKTAHAFAKKAAALAQARRKNAAAKKKGPVRGKAAARLQRKVRRIATHRKIRTARAAAVRGGRRSIRAANAVLSPLAAAGFLRMGKALGWAQRRMLRIANSSSGPAWAPRVARGVAAGIGAVMGAGLWVSRRRKIQSWLLRHYAATGAAGAAKATAAILGTAKHRPAHTAKPGPAVRITPATTSTSPGGTTMATASPDDIADAFDAFLASFEPESVPDLTAHFEAFAPMMERFCEATAKHAERLQDEYGITGNLTDMIQQFGSAFGGMCDLAQEVVESWRSEHEADIERTENPRPAEETLWNYKPGT